jgi:glucose-1-phosphate cytidylyltransferase
METKNGLVKNFVEKPKLPHWINSGIHVMNPDIFDLLPEKGSLEQEVLPLLAKGSEIAVFEHYGFWRAVETVKDLEEMNKFLEEL